MELWDILDSDRKHTGRTVERGNPMKQDEYHLVVHVWIKNNMGQFLIQQRAPNKSFPNLWSITGGSAVSGDDSLATALKEAFEEIGATLDPEKGRIIRQQKRQLPNFPDFVDVWLFNQDFEIDQLKLQPDEVSDARWADKKDIIQIAGQRRVRGRNRLSRGVPGKALLKTSGKPKFFIPKPAEESLSNSSFLDGKGIPPLAPKCRTQSG